MLFRTIEWKNNQVIMIDQRRLPTEEVYVTCKTYQDVAWAIKDMVIRGAPAIGVAAAMGAALGALSIQARNSDELMASLEKICTDLNATRPTAVNLAWGLARIKKTAAANANKSVAEIQRILCEEAQRMAVEDVELNRRIGSHGQELFKDGDQILTHCNAGALATAGYGTALGVIYAVVEAGKKIQVYADETRPFLQGARLTAWELHKNNVPVTLITDNMAGWMMNQGKISKIVVGADRIAANGDTANKIGTYSVAVLAKRHDIPFYVAAPLSTIDLATKTGNEIPIEERPAEEITHIKGVRVSPEGVPVFNPAFDVTPAELISGIITEKGVAKPPYTNSLRALFT